MTNNDERILIYRKRIADVLKKRRLSVNMIQQQVADALGLSVPTISKYESATLSIPAELIPIICEILRINITEFVKIFESDTKKQTSSEKEFLMAYYEKESVTQIVKHQSRGEMIFILRSRLDAVPKRNDAAYHQLWNNCTSVISLMENMNSKRGLKECFDYSMDLIENYLLLSKNGNKIDNDYVIPY